jgi:uncharacterized protein (TIGR00375 family)
MKEFYADLHIHIGVTEKGRFVKISAAKNLTFRNIAEEASSRKGIDIVGIIDAHAPGVQEDIDRMLAEGIMEELSGGGIRYENTTLLLGCELEVNDPGYGPAHLLAFFPTLERIKSFTDWLRPVMKNVELSSQRVYRLAREVQQEVEKLEGLLIPAHIFTPYKSVYGSATARMGDILDVERLSGVELGLSADSRMADQISELHGITFVTNSDAHSLGKIAREYNRILLREPSFAEVKKALGNEEGRRITANYGFNPRLGKYHRTYCSQCESLLDEQGSITERCIYCGSPKVVQGVMDRIEEIADVAEDQSPKHRPPYFYQVPLEFYPGLGPKKLSRLLEACGTEMDILHKATRDELLQGADETIVEMILKARKGELAVDTGGGGVYGRVRKQSLNL